MLGSTQDLRMGSQRGTFLGTQAGSLDAAKNGTRTEEKQTCLPVTIRAVQDAACNKSFDENGDLCIHGAPSRILVFVGVVENITKQQASVEFTLNDSSGRLPIKFYRTEDALSSEAGIEQGKYVSVVGNARMSPTFHICALCLRAIESADEVSYHMIETAHAALKLKTAAAGGDGTVTAEPAGQLPEEFQKAPAVKAQSEESSLKHLRIQDENQIPNTSGFEVTNDANLRGQLLSFIEKEGEGVEQGVHISQIRNQFQQIPVETIKRILSRLVDEGDTCHTIDEEHYAFV